VRAMTAADRPYMLDTIVFNHVREKKISSASFAGHRLLVIGVQADELRATKDVQLREELLAVFEEINPEGVLASSFALDIEAAGLDQACWNDGSGNFEKMLDRLQQLDRKNKKKKLPNQLRDVLIAETAIKNKVTLVSGDKNLQKVVSEFGGCAIDLSPPAAATKAAGARPPARRADPPETQRRRSLARSSPSRQ
jgi:predicted nucleic acid-binding protein